VDAACLCRWFIQQLTEGPTRYPEATLKYFSDLRGRIDADALAEFIDVKIIAEITSRVGLMLYFPAIILFLMLLAYNTFTFVWPWRPSWILIVFCHFAVALLSMVILQNSAKRARDASVASLEAKIQQARSARAVTEKERTTASLTEGEQLLEEMRGMRSGAFVGFAGNPVIGALLVPSGGTVLLELIRHFLEK
jgi:low affinity Fe/Cu permease